MAVFLIVGADCGFEKLKRGGVPDFLWGLQRIIKNVVFCNG